MHSAKAVWTLRSSRGYIAQDAFFLRAFVKAYALALARSRNLATAGDFHGLIGGALEELELHRDYAAELGIDLARVVPNRPCQAYTDFLLRTAWHGSLGDICRCGDSLHAPLRLPGQPARRTKPLPASLSALDRDLRRGGFERLAARIEALLDQVGADTRPVRDSYRYAMQCELDFFSGALRSTL